MLFDDAESFTVRLRAGDFANVDAQTRDFLLSSCKSVRRGDVYVPLAYRFEGSHPTNAQRRYVGALARLFHRSRPAGETEEDCAYAFFCADSPLGIPVWQLPERIAALRRLHSPLDASAPSSTAEDWVGEMIAEARRCMDVFCADPAAAAAAAAPATPAA